MSLSDKRLDNLKVAKGKFVYFEWDIKQAVKELKDELSNPRCFDDNPIAVSQSVEETINEIFGDKLV